MPGAPTVLWQASLLDPPEHGVDHDFSTLVRHQLDGTAWVDHAPGWLSGSDPLFASLLAGSAWKPHRRPMYDRIVDEPRLRAHYIATEETAVIEAARLALRARYGRAFDSIGLNLYRDGRDSVAWHGDRIPLTIVDPLVATISLGSPRPFRLRPKGGGSSVALHLHKGDLVVMGGTSQRTWDHCVPKVAVAGPRISVTIRHST